MHGRIMGGQQPVVGAVVSVWALGNTDYGKGSYVLASTISDESGNFAFNTAPSNSYTCEVAPPAVGSKPVTGTARPSAAQKTTTAASSNRKIFPALTPRAHPRDLPNTNDLYVYVTAVGGNSGGGTNSSISLIAGLGDCFAAQNQAVEINEVTTVATALALTNFSYNYGLDSFGAPPDQDQINAMDIADSATIQTLVDLPTGTVQPNTISSTGGTSVTIDAAKIYSLANTIASCVNSADDLSGSTPAPSAACKALFSDATIYTGTPDEIDPINTLEAANAIAYVPYNNVNALWQLGSAMPPFPGLSTAPNDWTVAVSYSTPAMGLALTPGPDGGPTSSSIDIDESGRVWFPSNKSGATGVGYFDVTANAFNGPFQGNYLVDPQYVAVDGADNSVFITDLGSNYIVTVDATPGSEGSYIAALTGNDDLGGIHPQTSGPIFANADGSVNFEYTDSEDGYNLVLVNSGGGGPVNQFDQFPTGLTLNTTEGTDPNDPSNPVAFAGTSAVSSPCEFELLSSTAHTASSTGTSCVTGGAATGAVGTTASSVAVQDEVAAVPSLNYFCTQQKGCYDGSGVLDGPQGVAFDGVNEAWFANSADGSLYPVQGRYDSTNGFSYTLTSPVPYLHGVGYGGTLTTPVGIAVDRAGNVWASNANCADQTDTTCIYTLSELIGTGFATITPLSLQADQLQGTEPASGLQPAAGVNPSSANRTPTGRRHPALASGKPLPRVAPR